MWSSVMTTPSISGNERVVLETNLVAARFYRLRLWTVSSYYTGLISIPKTHNDSAILHPGLMREVQVVRFQRVRNQRDRLFDFLY